MPFNPLLTRRTVLLFKEETTVGTDAAPVQATDALLVEEADFSLDVKMVERNFYVNHLSPQAQLAGRKLGSITFTHEMRGNGLAQTSVGNAPKLAQLMKSCGFSITNVAATPASRIGDVIAMDGNVGAATWAKAGTMTNTQPGVYTFTCTTGGASTVARFTMSCNNPDLLATPTTNITVTNGTAIPLTGTGGTVAPTLTAPLAIGDTFTVTVIPASNVLQPVSTGFKTGTLKLYLDGKLHVLLGSMGTFSVTSEGGGRATCSFTFTGVYGGTTDAALPSAPVFESTMVPLVERSLLTWGGNSSVAAAGWTFDLGATVTERTDVNAAEGTVGMLTTGRATKGGFSPEATLEADAAFWGSMAAGYRKSFFCRVGRVNGNAVAMDAPAVQTNTLGYADRDGLRTYDVGMMFTAGAVGDDEVRFIFY